MQKIIVALFLLLPLSAHAQFTKPPGVPTAVIADYGVTAGVWAVSTPIGEYVGVFSQSGGGPWYGCTQNQQFVVSSLSAAVDAAGGLQPYIETKAVPHINTILAACFPAIGPPPPGATVIDQLNSLLGTGYALRAIGSATVFGAK